MLKDSELQEVLDTYEEYGGTAEAAKALGIPGRTFRYRLLKAKERLVYKVPDGQTLKGVSTMYDAKGNEIIKWVKTSKDLEAQREVLALIAENLTKDLPAIKRISPPKNYNENLMSVIPFGDPHIGLYCSKQEVGEAFDLEIARNDLCSAFDYLISNSVSAKKCVILNLGDFFHASNYEGKTKRAGNVLDMAGRFPEIIDVGVEVLRFCIERAAEKHETVELVNAIGNHDDELAVCMSIMFRNIYKDNPRIKVYEAAKTRHYVRHGKVLIGVTHGHQTKDKELPVIMATEKPQDWGETRHRYFYRGHLHHDKRIELNGCMVEQFRTLAPSDSYSHGHAWFSGRDMKAITHHKEYGEVGRTVCSVDMLRDMM